MATYRKEDDIARYIDDNGEIEKFAKVLKEWKYRKFKLTEILKEHKIRAQMYKDYQKVAVAEFIKLNDKYSYNSIKHSVRPEYRYIVTYIYRLATGKVKWTDQN